MRHSVHRVKIMVEKNVPEFSAESLPSSGDSREILCTECLIRNYVSRVQKHSLPKQEFSCDSVITSGIGSQHCPKSPPVTAYSHNCIIRRHNLLLYRSLQLSTPDNLSIFLSPESLTPSYVTDWSPNVLTHQFTMPKAKWCFPQKSS